MTDIDRLAALIAEDVQDTYLLLSETQITEATDAHYLAAFNKSTVPLGPRTRETFGLPDAKYLKDLPPEHRLQIINRVRAIVDPAIKKYEPYFLNQVISGHLALHKIEEDSERLNNTVAGFVKLSRKAVWDGPKDIFKWPDWRILERKVTELAEKHIDYDEASKDSVVLFKKSYTNNAIALLLGGPPEVITYWFRAVNSPEAACRYGKGTTWCTSSKPAARGTPEYDEHYFHTYHKQGGLYIVELQTPTSPRHPIIQISGDEFMDAEDTSIQNVGVRLADFFRSALTAAAAQIHPATVKVMTVYCKRAGS